MARYANLPLQSNSAFQQRILNEIINAINTIDLDPLPTDAEFLHQAQDVLFAGTWLPGTSQNSMVLLPADNTRTTWVLGGGQSSTTPTITLQFNTGSCTTLNISGSLAAPNITLSSTTVATNSTNSITIVNQALVNGSQIVTQATLPTIPPAVQNSFALVTLTGSVTGTIGLIFNGNVLTMNVNIQVATANWNGGIIIANTFASTVWQNFIARLAANQMQTAPTTLDQWIAGTNNTQDDVRAQLSLTSNGLFMNGVPMADDDTLPLNTGDRFNVMVTWAVTR